MAEVYSKLYHFNSIGLRFFTVYGPYGRPDMSYYQFSKMLLNSKKINIHNKFNHSRDFTYISDVTNFIYKCYLDIKKIKKLETVYIMWVMEKKISLKSLVFLFEKNFKKNSRLTW